MDNLILYGAGGNMFRTLDFLASVGITPVCVCDGNKDKWHTVITYSNYYRGGMATHNNGEDPTQIELIILPFSEAIILYPDYYIYISTDFYIKCEITEQLIQSGMLDDVNRIINYEEYVRGCYWMSFMEMNLRWKTRDIESRICCSINRDVIKLASNNDEVADEFVSESISSFFLRRERVMSGSVLEECKNCINLVFIRKTRKITRINLCGHGVCQFKCAYCDPYYNIHDVENTYKAFAKYYNELKAQSLLSNDFAFSIALGEITVNPLENKILDFVIENTRETPNASQVISNCGVYSEKVAMILRNGGILTVSVDAGTRDSFKKIRGVDFYEQVLENIKKYISDGEVWIKYIFMRDGYNSSIEDIDGFMDFIALNRPALVMVSYDFNVITQDAKSKDIISEHILNHMAELVHKLQVIQQPYVYQGEFVSSMVRSRVESMASMK